MHYEKFLIETFKDNIYIYIYIYITMIMVLMIPDNDNDNVNPHSKFIKSDRSVGWLLLQPTPHPLTHNPFLLSRHNFLLLRRDDLILSQPVSTIIRILLLHPTTKPSLSLSTPTLQSLEVTSPSPTARISGQPRVMKLVPCHLPLMVSHTVPYSLG